MDFTLTDEQREVAELAERILAEMLPPSRLKEIEAGDDWFAGEVWAELARADLLGLSLPEAHGGGGYGLLEAVLVLEAVGRNTAPVPVLASVVLGGLAVAEFGSARQRDELLPGVASGEILLSAALSEGPYAPSPVTPATTAVSDGDRWHLNGRKTLITAAGRAHRILVPAMTDGGVTVFLLDPTVEGVTLVENRSLNHEPVHVMELADAVAGDADVLGEVGTGSAIVKRLEAWRTVGTCALQSGVCEAATRLTARYSTTRRQFEAPIATFQAVAHRLADAYIDTEAISLTSRRAAWALDNPALMEPHEVDEVVSVAGFWAADAAHRVVHAAQHVHGGVGVDTDYPVHRTFRWAKHLEFIGGHSTDHLRSLGRQLAAR